MGDKNEKNSVNSTFSVEVQIKLIKIINIDSFSGFWSYLFRKSVLKIIKMFGFINSSRVSLYRVTNLKVRHF